eukprot:4441927-Pyramimonas_sp.AAC.1
MHEDQDEDQDERTTMIAVAFLDVARPRQAIGRAERREAPPGGVPKGVGGRRPRIVKEAVAHQESIPQRNQNS